MASSVDKKAAAYSAEQLLKQFGRFINDCHQSFSALKSDWSPLASRCHDALTLRLTLMRHENVNWLDLIKSDNQDLNGIVYTFAYLCEEVGELRREALLLQQNFLMYDEDLVELQTEASGGRSVGNVLTKIRPDVAIRLVLRIQAFLDWCHNLLANICQQLGALFEHEKILLHLSSSLHFQCVFHAIADVLIIFVRFDEVLTHTNLLNLWGVLKRAVTSVKYNLEEFGGQFCLESIEELEARLEGIELFLNQSCLQNLFDHLFHVRREIQPKSLGVFSGHFTSYLKTTLSEAQKFPADLAEPHETCALIKLTAMCVFYHSFFGNLDKKLFRGVMEVNQKHCGVTLIGNIVWRPELFIRKFAATLVKANDKQDATKARKIFLDARVVSLPKEARVFTFLVASWTLEMRQTLKTPPHNLDPETIKQRCALFTLGAQTAGQLSHAIKSTTNLHVLLQQPMPKACLAAICKLMELLGLIRATFNEHLDTVLESIVCTTQNVAFQLLTILQTTKKKLSTGGGAYSERKLDILAAFQIAEQALFGPATPRRMLVTRLALGATDPKDTFSSDAIAKLGQYLKRAEGVTQLLDEVEALCDMSFLYWHQSIIPRHLKQIYERNSDLDRILYILHSTTDCATQLSLVQTTDFRCLVQFETNARKALDDEILSKLATNLETFLRLDYHSNLQLEKFNPFQQDAASYTCLKRFLAVKPIRIFGRQLLIKDRLEHYLSTTFYNLTAISLHDWRTYGEMRHLAYYKFGLETVDDFLPMQTLEQGTDVLEIMRNISVFVGKYLYNLNHQVFVEATSPNKHLNTITIRHVANSLRTHGLGIINTTVNYTYQFLRQKFHVFSQFLFDAQILRLLTKETRDPKAYSYERADGFNKAVKRLGLLPDGQSYMDLFRSLISHIGNAMGYVRMIRSGAMRSCADAAIFVPPHFDDESRRFVALTEELTPETREAAEGLEQVIEQLDRSYAGTEFFRLLVDTFAAFFRNPKHVHLRHFYLIVPPLTINYVEHMLTAKDKMTKRDRDGALFTDDGFAIGLAYVLTLLDQTAEFNSLHWFKTLRMKYANERREIESQQAKVTSQDDEKLRQTFALTLRRIASFQQEFDLLYYNLCSAKVFFQ